MKSVEKKEEKKKEEKIVTKYYGYFLMDSGLKVPFEEEEDYCDSDIIKLYNGEDFSRDRGNTILISEGDSCFNLLVDKIIGWSIDSDSFSEE